MKYGFRKQYIGLRWFQMTMDRPELGLFRVHHQLVGMTMPKEVLRKNLSQWVHCSLDTEELRP